MPYQIWRHALNGREEIDKITSSWGHFFIRSKGMAFFGIIYMFQWQERQIDVGVLVPFCFVWQVFAWSEVQVDMTNTKGVWWSWWEECDETALGWRKMSMTIKNRPRSSSRNRFQLVLKKKNSVPQVPLLACSLRTQGPVFGPVFSWNSQYIMDSNHSADCRASPFSPQKRVFYAPKVGTTNPQLYPTLK